MHLSLFEFLPVLSVVRLPPVNSELPEISPINPPFILSQPEAMAGRLQPRHLEQHKERGRREPQRFQWERRIFIPPS